MRRCSATKDSRSAGSSMAAILLANTAFTAASGPITAILAVVNAIVASGSNAGPDIAYSPAPYALRTTTDTLGTVASDTAVTILAPWRMMPWRSAAAPTMKPGTSARNTSGTLNASHRLMNRVHLSAESTNSTPPSCAGLLATTPTGVPSRRPKPTITSGAYSGLISKNDSASTMPSMSSCMSNGTCSSGGTSSAVIARAGAAAAYCGGSTRHEDGRYEKKAVAWSSASSSS